MTANSREYLKLKKTKQTRNNITSLFLRDMKEITKEVAFKIQSGDYGGKRLVTDICLCKLLELADS